MNNSKKRVQRVLEKREREFHNYVSGANAKAIEEQRKKEEHARAQERIKRENAKKLWEVENRPENLPKHNENIEKKFFEEPPKIKRERKQWGAPRPTHQNPMSELEISKQKVEESPQKETQQEESIKLLNNDTTNNEVKETISNKEEKSPKDNSKEEEEIQQQTPISTIKALDIKKIRQIMKEDKLRKANQETKGIEESVEKLKLIEKPLEKSPEKPMEKPIEKPREKSVENLEQVVEKPIEKPLCSEIEEEIAEDIDDNPKEEDNNINKPPTRLEPQYNSVKPALTRPARPLTAYNYLSGGKPTDSFSDMGHKEREYEQNKELPNNTKPVLNSKAKDETLLKRIRSLDEAQRQIFENILEQVENEDLDSDDILSNLKFITAKSSNIAKGEEFKLPTSLAGKEKTKKQNIDEKENENNSPTKFLKLKK